MKHDNKTFYNKQKVEKKNNILKTEDDCCQQRVARSNVLVLCCVACYGALPVVRFFCTAPPEYAGEATLAKSFITTVYFGCHGSQCSNNFGLDLCMPEKGMEWVQIDRVFFFFTSSCVHFVFSHVVSASLWVKANNHLSQFGSWAKQWKTLCAIVGLLSYLLCSSF